MINHYYLLRYYCLAFSSFFCYFHSQMDNSPSFSLRGVCYCHLVCFNRIMHATCSWSEVSGVMWGPWGGSSISLSLQTLHIATAAVWSLLAFRGPPDPSSCLPIPFSWRDLYRFWKDWQIVSFRTWEQKTFIYYLRHKVTSNFFVCFDKSLGMTLQH